MSDINYEAESELSCLVQALENVIDAKAQQGKAYNECESSSPGWALSSYDDAVSDAVADFGNKLGTVIDRRIDAKIKDLKATPSGEIS